MHSYALVVLTLIPLVGSLVVFSLRSEQGKLAKQISLFVSLVVVVYALVLAFRFDSKRHAPHPVSGRGNQRSIEVARDCGHGPGPNAMDGR